MSNNTAKLTRPTLKVTKSSGRMNHSSSGMYRPNLSTTISRSINAASRKSFSLAGDSKVLDKSSTQTLKHIVQALDEMGKDVTPQALYHPEPGTVQTKQNKIFAPHDTSAGTISDFLSTAFHTTNASFAAPFTRSFFGSTSVSRSSQSTTESITDDIEDPSSKRDTLIGLSDVQVQKEDVKEQVREHTLDSVVDCYLTETETIWLLDIPAVSVSVDSDEAEVIKERNNAYTELCNSRPGNDKYAERSMQTFNRAPKVMETQTSSIIMVEKATTATTWDIYDSYAGGSTAEVPGSISGGERPIIRTDSSSHHLDSSRSLDRSRSGVNTTSIASTTSSRRGMEAFVVEVEDKPDPELILKSEKFQQDLEVMERAVLQNIYQPKHAAYRLLPILTDSDILKTEKGDLEESSQSPALKHLWAFSCELTVAHNVSCMAWNKKNPDLLAVGYEQLDINDQKSGLVCCWSLKNPQWPDRIFQCESAVTSLDFSASNASQLAVGMHDGSIVIYNVQFTKKTPVIDSSNCDPKHTGPVWQVKWIDCEQNSTGASEAEMLISVAADGRVCKWFFRECLTCIDLMKLTVMRNDSGALISSQAPGLCFDFHRNNSNIYLTGTGEGHIHKCSCSYNEQFLDTYKAHKGPVRKVTWSPFCPDVFLSCSADWTIQLWRQDLFTPVLGFTSTQNAVHDVMWSPRWATVFGVINEDRVEIWNLGASTQDPTVVSVANPGVKLTSLLFASETDCVLVGDSEGRVSVYKLENLAVEAGTQANTLEDIIRSTLATQLWREQTITE
ncbi:dynein axonemal intermediate chain 4 [Astyanax mexicanus]|uniref:Dynein axonemal intermediate chain 4 n=1 Tax=Astyanax mexicanus TaxID=7994 RepID=A0A8B9JYZ0_ASTMX|nr:dynein axonemal intermediate chain 4 [Astyanax mexicanus]KAG9277329.1 WD repeat-containing protein 78 isoform X1 [Astyanax mexicanus]